MTTLKKKHLLFVVPVIGVLVLGGVILAQPDKKENKAAVRDHTTSKQESIEEAPIAEETPVEQTTQSVASAPDPEPTPQPDYGEDPSSPGTFIVFNKTKVMTEAGIPANQHEYADKVISLRSGWKYKDSNGVNLCNAQPASVMASTGSDYETNPVTQLKWCHDYFYKKYNKPNNWEVAYSMYQRSN